MNPFRAAPWLILVVACADPGSESQAAARVEVTDSAGVQLVRNRDSVVDTLAVQVIEAFRLGNVEGPEHSQFFRITGVVIDDAGRLFVVDQGTKAVRVFDADGRFVRKFGGPGSGPGEFRFIGGLFRWRDTVHVADLDQFRGFLFDTTGVLLSSYKGRLPGGSLVLPVSGGPDGWYLTDDSLFSRRAREQVGVAIQNTTIIARMDARLLQRATRSREAADSLLRPVTRYLGIRIFGMIGSEGGSERVVLGNEPFFEPSPSRAIDGHGLVYVAAGWPYRIDVYDAKGKHVRRISRDHDSIPVTNTLINEVMRRAKAHYDTTSQRGGASYHTYSERAKMPTIGFVPVTGPLRVSEDGWLWVRRLDVDPDPVALVWSTGVTPRPTYWDVYDPDGRFQKMVRLPPRFSLHQVLSDAAIGVQRDEFDVEYVVRYRFLQPAEAERR